MTSVNCQPSTVNSKIRVLVVDDSALMRKKIAEIINSSVDCEVVATARDGYEAIQITQALKPDVITLDLQLPKMDGLTCLGYIMSDWPTPVVILSAFAQEGSLAAIEALEYGAVDIVAKPGGVISLNLERAKEELLTKIRVANRVSIKKLKLRLFQRTRKLKKDFRISMNKLVAIGASTGGPRAVTEVLTHLPGDLPAAILVVQHMPAGFTKSFAERLDQECELQVKEAEDGEPITAGKVLVAPSGFTMKAVRLSGEGEVVRIKKEEVELHYISPSVDQTFSSVAPVFGRNAVGVILTGMGDDGTEGCKRIKEYGGSTLAEDESSCVVYGMPASAAKAGVIDQTIPLEKIPNAIMAKVRRE